MIQIFADATHLYPGATGAVEIGIGDLPPGGTKAAVSLVFSDGITAGGWIERGAARTLRVAAHETAAGTGIADRSWVVDILADPNRIRLRIVRRLPDRLN